MEALQMPTAAQIALAVVIIESKPIDLSLDEHIARVGRVIVNDRRAQQVGSAKYIDGTRFWKEAFEKCENEREALRDQVFELEQQLANVKRTTLEPTQTASEKTKLRGQSNKANTQSKRRRLNDGSAVEISPEAEFEAEFENLLDLLGQQVLLRAAAHLICLMRKGNTDDHAVSHAVSFCCHAAIKCLKDVCRPSPSGSDTTNSTACEELCFAIRRLWPYILRALEVIHTGAGSPGHATCAPDLVLVFQALLGQLHQFALDEADRRLKLEEHQRSITKRYPGTVSEADMVLQYENRCRHITTTMKAITQSFQEQSGWQSQIFQGLVSVLLEHVGSCVGLLVFGDTEIDHDDKGVAPPQGLLDTQHIETDIAMRTVELAAPYLAFLLRNILVKAHTNATLLSVGHTKSEDASGTLLTSRMTERLQKTLLRGLYGSDDHLFQGAYEQPAIHSSSPSELNAMVKLVKKERKDPEWFIQQVWEQLGWDILTAEY